MNVICSFSKNKTKWLFLVVSAESAELSYTAWVCRFLCVLFLLMISVWGGQISFKYLYPDTVTNTFTMVINFHMLPNVSFYIKSWNTFKS